MSIAIHHINWLVHDINASAKQFAMFLGQEAQVEYLPKRNADTARFSLGNAWLVLVSPRDPHSVVGRILATRGEGLFLLSLSGIDELNDHQVSMMDKAGIRQGIDDWNVWDISGLSTDTSVLQLHRDKP